MKNPFKKNKEEKEALLKKISELQKANQELKQENKELSFRTISLEVQNKRKSNDVDFWSEKAETLIEQNKKLQKELFVLQIRYDTIEQLRREKSNEYQKRA